VTINASWSPQAVGRQPNIVFFLADDLGYREVGGYGQKIIRTPNIDKLIEEGMHFTQHYSGSPVCAPSRCVLLTGKHPGHAYIRTNRFYPPEGNEPIPENTWTIAKMFQNSGYETGGFGKWGLGGVDSSGAALKQGFDRFYGYYCQTHAHWFHPKHLWHDTTKILLDNPDVPHTGRIPPEADPHDRSNYSLFEGKVYGPDLYSEQALRFIRDNKDRPFFLYYPTLVPHLPLSVPEDSLREYEGLWSDPPYVGGNGYLPNRTPRATYAAMVTRMDREIGRMMALVKELGLDNDTIFVFTSDNGPAYDRLGGTDSEFFDSTGGLRGLKGSLYEGGVRVPMVVRWTGRVRAGSVSDRVTGFEDWMPTFADLLGIENEAGDIDGISFASTLEGKLQEKRSFLYREFPSYGGQQSVRIGPWKGIRQNLEKGDDSLKLELYNLKNDPGESVDVADTHSDIVARIEKIMRQQHRPSKTFPFPALDQLSAENSDAGKNDPLK